MITKLSIARIVGLMMGVWFLSISVAQYVAGVVAQFASVETVGGQVTNLKVSLDTYPAMFTTIAWIAIGAGVVLFLLSLAAQEVDAWRQIRLRGRARSRRRACCPAARRSSRKPKPAPRGPHQRGPVSVDLRPLSRRADRRSATPPCSTARAGGSTTARSCSPTARSRRSAGPTRRVPAGALEIDGTGKWVTPGIIDIHSHLGDYPSPGVEALSRRQRGDLAGAARKCGPSIACGRRTRASAARWSTAA